MSEPTRRIRYSIMGAMMILLAGAASADWEAGVAAFAAGDYATAAEHFAGVVKSNPNWPGGYLMLGRCELAQENPAGAVEHLQVAYDLAPDKPDHLVALGRALLANEDHSMLVVLLESADRSNLNPEVRTEITVLTARAKIGAGDPEGAVEVLQEGVTDDPGNAVLFRTLGLMLKNTGDRSGAIDALARAFELDSEEVASATLAVHLALELATEEAEEDRTVRYDRAFELASALATAAPTHEHQLLAGEAALGARDLERAESWFSDAVASGADDPLALYYRGRTRSALHRDEEALEDLRSALAASPDVDLNLRIHDQLGRLMACRLELAEAAEHYRNAGNDERAARIDEVASSSREALATLAELRSELAELEGLREQLQELGDDKGVAAISARISGFERQIEGIEDNLEEVRRALCF